MPARRCSSSCPLLAADTQTFTYSGDSMNTVLAEGNQQALLTGHARVDTEDMRITADQIRLFGKDFIYAQCSGNVHVVDAKRGLDLTSQSSSMTGTRRSPASPGTRSWRMSRMRWS